MDAFRGVLLFALLVCTCNIVGASNSNDGPQLVKLTDKTFEHDTQSASGQTTGIWFVLFGAPDSPSCEAIEDAFSELAQDSEGGTIFAKVDITKNPFLAYRFDIQSTPVLKLFRDRKMYSYTGSHTVPHIRAFLKSGFKSAQPEDVPLEKGVLEQIVEKMGSLWTAYHEVNPLHRLAGALLFLLVAVSLIRFQQTGSDRDRKRGAYIQRTLQKTKEKKGN